MGGDDGVGARAAAGAFTDDIADGVDADVFEPEGLEDAPELESALFLLAGGGGDFADAALFGDDLRFDGFRVLQRLLDRRRLRERGGIEHEKKQCGREHSLYCASLMADRSQ